MKHEELSKKIKLIFVNHHSLELIFDKIDHFLIIKAKNILDMKLNLTMLTPHELFTSPSSRLANVRRLNNTKFNMKEILVKQNFCNYQDDILCTSYKYFGKNLLNCLDKVN